MAEIFSVNHIQLWTIHPFTSSKKPPCRVLHPNIPAQGGREQVRMSWAAALDSLVLVLAMVEAQRGLGPAVWVVCRA